MAVKKIEDILELMGHINVQIEHIFRESNQLAYHITNTIFDQKEVMQVYSFNQLKRMGRKILNNDKSGIPKVRIKYKENYLQRDASKKQG